MTPSLANLIGYGTSALITLLISIHLIRSYFKSRETTVGYFASFISVRFGIFASFTLVNLTYLASGSLLIPAVFFTTAWAFIFFSLIFPSLLFCQLLNWKSAKIIYPGLIGVAGIVAVSAAIINFTPVKINPETLLPFVNPVQLTVILYALSKVFGVFPLAILFLSQVRKPEKWIKIRSFLIGLGLVWVVSTIIAPILLTGTISGLYTAVGDVLIFAGIKYGQNKSGQIAKQPTA